MNDLWLAIAHDLVAFALAAILAVEIALVRPAMTAEQVVRLRRLDSFYGSLIGLVILIGILRVNNSPKGQEFYTSDPVFWMKMAAFALIGLLSVIPTIRIYHWWQQAKTGGFFLAPQAEVARVRLFLTIEAALFACVIGLAAAMAHGNAP